MNNIQYIRSGQKWDKNEDLQLVKEYDIDKLNLLDICKIHKRKSGGIISRLKKNNLIDMDFNVRGYSEYQKINQEELNKECEENKINDNVLFDTKVEDENFGYTNRKQFRLKQRQMPDEILQIKKDINDIKKDMKKIFELINTVYQFENNIE
jgi:hypothetical protein